MYIPASSRTYLFIPLDAPYDMAVLAGPGYLTEIALAADDGSEPGDADYHAAQWIAAEPALLIGPGGGQVYPPGSYMAFARVTAGAERVVLPSGRVRIGGPAT